MKIAYFDCFSGISGDMVLGALIDAGLPLQIFSKLINDLNFHHCKVTSKKVKRARIVATKVDVTFSPNEKRRPAEMLNLIEGLNLPAQLKEKSKEIFLSLLKAEVKIHQESLETLHLHELGSLDTLIDIVGTVVGLNTLGIEKVWTSKINLGGGRVNTAHGNFPVPAPATTELLRGFPVYSSEVEAELTTPTGAAILKGLCADCGPIPDMKLEKVGYGAGAKDLSTPNLLRLLIGKTEASLQEDFVSILETNIDDMSPQIYEYITDCIFQKGALDVFLTSVQMKKNRPGILLTVVCPQDKEEDILSIIFRETTTLGVRISRTIRRKLKREIKSFQSSLGEVKIKLGILGEDIVSSNPEYEDCKRIARKKNLPLKKVYEIIKNEISGKFSYPKL
ncbi:nickel pincer cofactor biosynthesis protein LarC [Candidatus Aerophobetes bacterium]|nr:nickel pincer cofactor biosynthesis protein LarC [Candidatus Aerophobetes bacterium]